MGFRFGLGEKYSKRDWIRNLIPLIYGNWFVVNYIMLYCFIPFINKFLLSIDKNTFKKLMIITIVVYSIVPSVFYYIDKYQWSFSNFDYMIVTYLLGAYIRLYGIPKFEKPIDKINWVCDNFECTQKVLENKDGKQENKQGFIEE